MHYYDYNRILSYNVPVNVLIGERGVGKSYGAKKYVIKKYLKDKSQFLYLRRYDNEIKTISNPEKPFFGDVEKEFEGHTFNVKNRKFYIDGEIFGEAKRMTEAQDLKSAGSFENVKTIIIDEYPIEKNKRYYLPDERNVINGYIRLNFKK